MYTVYLNDILFLFLEDASLHLTHIRNVLECFRKQAFAKFEKKNAFDLPQLCYLNHWISEEGL